MIEIDKGGRGEASSQIAERPLQPLFGSDTNGMLKLVTTKPDAELAAEFKTRLVEAYGPIMALIDEIDAAGFEAQIACSKGALGKQVIAQLHVLKRY